MKNKATSEPSPNIVASNRRDFDYALEVFAGSDTFDYDRCKLCDIKLHQKTHVAGIIQSVLIVPYDYFYNFEATVFDGTGRITLVFFGRSHIPGIDPGRMISVFALVAMRDGEPVMYNPSYNFARRVAAAIRPISAAPVNLATMESVSRSSDAIIFRNPNGRSA
jgi:hypothetical protein